MNKVKPARAFGLTGLTAVLVCYLFIATKTCAASNYMYFNHSKVPAEMVGTWNSVSVVHADLLEAMGVPRAKQLALQKNAIRLVLKRIPCGWKVTTILGYFISDVIFPLGIEIDAKWMNGKYKRTLVYEQGETMVEVMKVKNGVLKTVRSIENSSLVTKVQFKNAVATIVYRRATSV